MHNKWTIFCRQRSYRVAATGLQQGFCGLRIPSNPNTLLQPRSLAAKGRRQSLHTNSHKHTRTHSQHTRHTQAVQKPGSIAAHAYTHKHTRQTRRSCVYVCTHTGGGASCYMPACVYVDGCVCAYVPACITHTHTMASCDKAIGRACPRVTSDTHGSRTSFVVFFVLRRRLQGQQPSLLLQATESV